MRIILFVLSWSILYTAKSQLTLVPLKYKQPLKQTAANITIPFWDDFSQSRDVPDSTLWLHGNTVYVNATLGLNPPTYNVATFDGLNGNGQSYNITSQFIGKTDSLISHYIDLSQADRTSTYLSFYWQAKGNGEAPDQEDSIRLQLRSSELEDPWKTVWVKTGDVTDFSFSQELIAINNPIFFHDSLQIKFESYASLNGPFDTWNIDYIYLNDLRNERDTFHFDRALTGSISPLFSPYYQIPAVHYFYGTGQRFSTQQTQVSNLDAVNHPLDYFHVVKNETMNAVYFDESLGNGEQGGLTSLELRDIIGFTPTISDTLSTNLLDSQVISSTFYYKTGDTLLFETNPSGERIYNNIDLTVNDTIRSHYTLYDQYSYDDGTAEFAAGINLNTGKVAIRYIIKVKDTLTHIRIQFPDISPDSKDSPLDIIVWGRTLDKETSRQTYSIAKGNNRNEFSEISLNYPLIVSDTFYIGYEQFTDNIISIGFDRNNPEASSSIFTNISGEWQQNNRLSGALMIRPVFKHDTTTILSNTKSLTKSIKVYPNPASDYIQIDGDYQSVNIYTLSGLLIYHSSKKELHSIHTLNNGVFLIQIVNDKKISYKKLIIDHR